MKSFVRSVVLMVIAVYFLTPYTAKSVVIGCSHGNGDFICYCCKPGHNSGDVVSIKKCVGTSTIEEAYAHPLVILPHVSVVLFYAPYNQDEIPNFDKSPLKGFKSIPVKPPIFSA